jgi:hypothetical protein
MRIWLENTNQPPPQQQQQSQNIAQPNILDMDFDSG